MSDLSNRTALVTGASRGIGAAVARRLAASGAHVAITFHRSSDRADAVVREIQDAGGRARAFRADGADPASSPRLVEAVTGAFGGLDILVNNAGTFSPAPLAESSAETYADNFDLNVRGVHELTRAALPHLREGGRIINIGSGYGRRPGPGTGAYAATKAAVHAFTQAWSKELAARRITVNTVSPGSTDTELNPADATLNPSAEAQRASTPLGRFGTVHEVAAVVAFLVGPEATFVTGAEIPVDGGFTA